MALTAVVILKHMVAVAPSTGRILEPCRAASSRRSSGMGIVFVKGYAVPGAAFTVLGRAYFKETYV